jgi:TolB-like protein/class 3 adenylate cyclase/Tfp pilus assembly protein PilF
MSAEVKKEIQLEIAHVLFIDIVAYSKMAIDDQRAAIEQLNQIVQSTDEFRKAESENRLLKIPTGDGMALVFYQSPEAPVECALEISRGLKEHLRLKLRMGVHSGPVSGVIDVNGRVNVAGEGINMAQRVMDCGDAGHILLSKRVAEDLHQFSHWRPHLYELGECEVKHGVRVSVVNLFTAELGNSDRPRSLSKLPDKSDAAPVAAEPPTSQLRKRGLIIFVCAAIAALAVAGFLFWHRLLLSPAAVSTPAPSTLPTPATPAAPTIPEKSIAVLPFENLSEEKANAFFADGVQDEILTDLARVADLKVISRTSVMQYKSGIARNLREIAQQLGVANVVEGSVQRSGNRVRVNAQLVDARTDKHLWGQTYDRDLADVFAIQSEIAKMIADQLQAKLSPTEKSAIERHPTSDITAFDLYTRAKNLLLTASFRSTTKADLLQAADLLNQAVAHDPSFFEAYYQLAYAHDQLYFLGYDPTPTRLALAETAIQAAVRLRPDAGETHLARAQNLYNGYLDYDGALAELEVARQTLPHDARVFALKGYVQRRQGKPGEALQSLESAVNLDPRNFFTLQQMAVMYGYLRRYPEQKSAYDRALAIEPNDVGTQVMRAFVELDWKADSRPLHQMIESIRSANPGAIHNIDVYWLFCALAERDAAAARDALIALGDNGFNDNAVHFNRPFAEGIVARMTKDEDKARSAFTVARIEQEKIVQAQPNYAPALCALGLIDAGLVRKEEALREGQRAVELLPVTKDALNGMIMIKYLAIIAAWVGDRDLACEQLATAIHMASSLTYGQLKLLPFWDPLRGDPRFEKLADEAKQPVALK